MRRGKVGKGGGKEADEMKRRKRRRKRRKRRRNQSKSRRKRRKKMRTRRKRHGKGEIYALNFFLLTSALFIPTHCCLASTSLLNFSKNLPRMRLPFNALCLFK